jgi:ubiquinone/menaquinone biosynthesis C-methylase UbiE
MPSISDSDAFLNSQKLLPQHQSAIQLLMNILANPKAENVTWLDLACGKGQILSQLQLNLREEARKKVNYVGFDLNVEFGRLTEKVARQLLFRTSQIEYGELENFSTIVRRQTFDFITLTNTLHEIAPLMVPTILLDCIDHLSADGILYVYDMESLHPPELGAVPWKCSEIQSIIDALLDAMAVKAYKPFAASWAHSRVHGWSFSIDKTLISAELSATPYREEAIKSANEKVVEILKRRRFECHSALESLTRFGATTEKESAQKIDLLYEYWSIQLALEIKK